jgi:hypothetical protein
MTAMLLPPVSASRPPCFSVDCAATSSTVGALVPELGWPSSFE